MTHSENANPDAHIWVLARASDPLCTLLPPFLRERKLCFSIVNNIYQALGQLQTHPTGQSVVLIGPPAMLAPEALKVMLTQFPRLKIIGWCRAGEALTDVTFSQIAGYGVVPVSDPGQLSQVLTALLKSQPQTPAKPELTEQAERLKYDISDEEMNMLLGTAK